MDKEYTPAEAKAWLSGYDEGKKISTSEKITQTSDTKPEESARAWVKLTDDEINEIFGDYMDSLDSNEDGQTWLYERLIEAKLRDKNA
jgi:hypothetical protein